MWLVRRVWSPNIPPRYNIPPFVCSGADCTSQSSLAESSITTKQSGWEQVASAQLEKVWFLCWTRQTDAGWFRGTTESGRGEKDWLELRARSRLFLLLVGLSCVTAKQPENTVTWRCFHEKPVINNIISWGGAVVWRSGGCWFHPSTAPEPCTCPRWSGWSLAWPWISITLSL